MELVDHISTSGEFSVVSVLLKAGFLNSIEYSVQGIGSEHLC